MKLLQSWCLLRLSKDFSNVMSRSMPSELWMKSYWGKQPSNTVFKSCAAEMQQNSFLQVTCSATSNLKRKSIVSIHNEPLEGEICHMPQVGGHWGLSVSHQWFWCATIQSIFLKHTFDLNFKAASAWIGPNKLGVLLYYFCNKERMLLLKKLIFAVRVYVPGVVSSQVLFICMYEQWHEYGQFFTFFLVA